jgi:hypothetical protein
MKKLLLVAAVAALQSVMLPNAIAAASADACIDNFCIGAPIKAFRQEWVMDSYGGFTSAERFAQLNGMYPVCKATRFTVPMRSKEGRRVLVGFAALVGPKGEHFRAIDLSVNQAGNFTPEQMKQVYESKKMPGMVLSGSSSATKLYGTTKDSVNLTVDISPDGMGLRYDFPLGNNQVLLTKQAGCLSEVPKF